MNKLTAAHSALTLTLGLTCLYLLQERDAARGQQLVTGVATRAAVRPSEQSQPPNSAANDPKKPRAGSGEPVLPEEAPPLVQVGPQTEYLEMERLRRQDPRYRTAQTESLRLAILWQYPSLIADVGYAKAEQIAALWSERDNASRPAPAEAPALTPKQYIEQRRAADAELVKLVAAKLGDDVAGKFEGFLQQRGATFEVNSLQSVLAGSEAALREDQVDGLLTALSRAKETLALEIAEEEEIADAVEPVEKGPLRTMAGRLRWFESRIARAEREARLLRETAAGYLSPVQMQQFDRMLARSVRLEQLQLDREKVDARIVAARAQPQQR